jgi:hypothetical protein
VLGFAPGRNKWAHKKSGVDESAPQFLGQQLADGCGLGGGQGIGTAAVAVCSPSITERPPGCYRGSQKIFQRDKNAREFDVSPLAIDCQRSIFSISA